MPYIKQEDRTLLTELANDVSVELDRLNTKAPGYAGNLNYFVTRILDNTLRDNLSYSRVNELIGALECIKLELYRRLAAP